MRIVKKKMGKLVAGYYALTFFKFFASNYAIFSNTSKYTQPLKPLSLFIEYNSMLLELIFQIQGIINKKRICVLFTSFAVNAYPIPSVKNSS